MTLPTADQVRLRIQDPAKPAYVIQYGDGVTTRFNLDHNNITSGTAYVMVGGTAWSATGATFNVSGFVTFSSIVSANSGVRFDYVYSTFSDAEIGHFTAVGGSVPGAALQALRALRFDGLKRARWMGSDASQYDDTMAINELARMESALRTEVEEEAIAGGSFIGWGETQEDYT